MKYVVTALLIVLGLTISVPLTAHSANITHTDNYIKLEGDIIRGDAISLQLVIDRTGLNIIHLSSDGGLALEGYSLGHVIRTNKMRTIIPDDANCMSACAIAFISGSSMYSSGILGFHVAWSPDDSLPYSDGMKSGQLIGAVNAIYWFNMGYTTQVPLMIAQLTDSSTFLVLSVDDLDLFKMVDKDYTKFIELPKNWLYERIADPLRLQLLRKGH